MHIRLWALALLTLPLVSHAATHYTLGHVATEHQTKKEAQSATTQLNSSSEYLYAPINDNLAKIWGVTPSSLAESLGIEPKAEELLAERVRVACSEVGLAPSKCSHEGKTLSDMKQLADTGNPIYQNNYAHRLENIVNDVPAQKVAFRYFLSAAKQGLPHAQVTIGWKLLHGIGTSRDPVAAFEWNKRGALQGHPEGANNLGFQYAYGIGVKQNYESAINWFTYAALRGSTIAYGYLLAIKVKQ